MWDTNKPKFCINGDWTGTTCRCWPNYEGMECQYPRCYNGGYRLANGLACICATGFELPHCLQCKSSSLGTGKRCESTKITMGATNVGAPLHVVITFICLIVTCGLIVLCTLMIRCNAMYRWAQIFDNNADAHYDPEQYPASRRVKRRQRKRSYSCRRGFPRDDRVKCQRKRSASPSVRTLMPSTSDGRRTALDDFYLETVPIFDGNGNFRGYGAVGHQSGQVSLPRNRSDESLVRWQQVVPPAYEAIVTPPPSYAETTLGDG